MKRIILLLIVSIFLIGCSERETFKEKEIQLADGKIINVEVSENEIEKDIRVLSVIYQVDEKVEKEETVEKEVLEVWSKLEKEINRTELDEAVIKPRYFIGNDEKSNKPIYLDFIYNAEKTENGTWKITKVN
jgi:hypothetical protein